MAPSIKEKIGLAMYTIHQSAQADLENALMQTAAAGCRGIEFYGGLEFDSETVRRALERSGLTLTGWHVEWRTLQEDRFDKTVRYLQEVGCPMAVVPCLGGKWQIAHTQAQESEQIWQTHIAWLNETARRLTSEGLRMGYHNHEHEFMLHYGGKPLFDYLFDQLSGQIVMEFDTGNCIEGGDDPLRVLKKYRDRAMILHLKPYSHRLGFDVVLGEAQDENDWPAILAARPFEWLLLESENTQLPEWENAGRCLKQLYEYTSALESSAPEKGSSFGLPQ